MDETLQASHGQTRKEAILKLTKKEVPGAVIVGIEGKFFGGPENSDKFHSFFKKLVAEGHNKVVIDLGKTPYANSQGIGMLISTHTSLANAGGELVLARPTNRISDILTVTRLLLIFKSYDTVEEAVEYITASE